MGFELVPAKQAKTTQIGERQASLGAIGLLTMRGEDLPWPATKTLAAVMLDRALQRIAVRVATDEEAAMAVKIGRIGKARKTVRVSIGHAIAAIGLDRKKTAGMYEINVKDQMIWIDLKAKLKR